MISTLLHTIAVLALYFFAGTLLLTLVDTRRELAAWYDSIPQHARTREQAWWMGTGFWLCWPAVLVAYLWLKWHTLERKE